MTYFLDACISRRLSESLRLFGVDIDDPFVRFGDGSSPDATWIPLVCKEGRIIISADRAQTKGRGKTAVELQLLKKHRGRAFYLPATFPEWGIWRQVACFFRCWQTIAGIGAEIKRGEVYQLSESGNATRRNFRKP